MVDPEHINADQLAFRSGLGGRTWVARQGHTDITSGADDGGIARLRRAARRRAGTGHGCGCGATTLELARAVGPGGRVAALDISGPMLAEGKARGESAGIANIDWQQADAATASLEGFDLLTSAFGQIGAVTAGCPTSRRRSSQPPSRPSGGAGDTSGGRKRSPARCDMVGARLGARLPLVEQGLAHDAAAGGTHPRQLRRDRADVRSDR